MNQQTVKCPNCGEEFEIGSALIEKLDRDLRAGYEDKIKAEREKLATEREKLVADAKAEAAEESGLELQSVKQELAEKNSKLAEARKTEIELRKKERELVERNEALDLEVLKKVDEERAKITELAEAKAAEKEQLKIRERDNLIKSLNEKIGDLQRRIEVGSQEGQGEALEGELIDVLRARFPIDECEEVKKGQRGADIQQRVRDHTGKMCGTILWETKNTKAFAKDWIDKLKQDQQEAGADLAVLMTMALPKGIEDFDLHQDVWVTSFGSALSLCGVLRQMLIGVERQRLVSKHQEDVKDVLYAYITSNEFAQRVRMIVSAFQKMDAELGREKTAMENLWKRRRKQIERVLENFSGLWGEIDVLTGEAGESLPKIEAFTLEAIGEEEEGGLD
jgi:hypothetical protein